MVRLGYIDYIKSFAILLVLLTHAHELAVIKSVPMTSILYSIDRMGVPLFLMASGILMLDKAKEKGLEIFKSPRLYQFILLLIIYSILTNAITYHLKNNYSWFNSFSFAFEFNNILLYGRTGSAVHLWYMFLFIPLYILSPYISKMVSSCSDRELLVFIAICVLLNQGATSYDALMGEATIINHFYKDMTGACLSFFIFGYWYCRKFNTPKIQMNNVLFGCFLFILTIYIKFNLEVEQGKILGVLNWYNSSISIAISSFGFFIVFYELTKNLKPSKAITFIAKFSFGTYLIHYGILLIAVNFLNPTLITLNSMERAVSLFIISLSSFPVCYLLSKIKITKWLTGG